MTRHGEYKVPGGKLVVADVDVTRGVLSKVQLSGDFFLEPDTLLEVMCAALQGQRADLSETELANVVGAALPAGAALIGLTPAGVATAVKRALAAEHRP